MEKFFMNILSPKIQQSVSHVPVLRENAADVVLIIY